MKRLNWTKRRIASFVIALVIYLPTLAVIGYGITYYFIDSGKTKSAYSYSIAYIDFHSALVNGDLSKIDAAEARLIKAKKKVACKAKETELETYYQEPSAFCSVYALELKKKNEQALSAYYDAIESGVPKDDFLEFRLLYKAGRERDAFELMMARIKTNVIETDFYKNCFDYSPTKYSLDFRRAITLERTTRIKLTPFKRFQDFVSFVEEQAGSDVAYQEQLTFCRRVEENKEKQDALMEKTTVDFMPTQNEIENKRKE